MVPQGLHYLRQMENYLQEEFEMLMEVVSVLPGLISGSGTGSNKPSCFICRLSKACRRAASSRQAGRGLSCLVDCKVDPLAVGSSFGKCSTCGEYWKTLLG